MASASNQSETSQGQEEKMSAVELAYQDQGYHEMEFTTGDENELKMRKKQCSKNPGHPTFIPAKKFTMEHLPERWRDKLVFDYITSMIGLTVRVVVKYTSKDRPAKFPLFRRRGQYGVTAYGSGWVDLEFEDFKNYRSTCPCKKCQKSPHLAKKHVWAFFVRTASHVVFDESEAKHTKCNLFFDSDDDYNYPSLKGVDAPFCNPTNDNCMMICVTHDEDVYKKLCGIFYQYQILERYMYEKYGKIPVTDIKRDVVVISHPHGLSKQITVGETTHTPRIGDQDKCKYNAETCPGSSGGRVILMWDMVILNYDGTTVPQRVTHSGCREKGKNESIRGFLFYY